MLEFTYIWVFENYVAFLCFQNKWNEVYRKLSLLLLFKSYCVFCKETWKGFIFIYLSIIFFVFTFILILLFFSILLEFFMDNSDLEFCIFCSCKLVCNTNRQLCLLIQFALHIMYLLRLSTHYIRFQFKY